VLEHVVMMTFIQQSPLYCTPRSTKRESAFLSDCKGNDGLVRTLMSKKPEGKTNFCPALVGVFLRLIRMFDLPAL